MSEKKYLDENGLLYVWTKLKTLFAGKVDKEVGKGLSTEDYTTAEQTKLTGIEAGAEVNILEGIQVNGTAVTPTNKVANITVPTNNNELTNGAGYQTAQDVSTAISGKEDTSNKKTSITSSSTDTDYPSALAVKNYVDSAVGSITGISFQIVASLPATGQNGVIYLLSNSGTAPNIYDEYIWISSSSSFEKIGTTDIDLSNYVQYSDLVTITNAEIDTIFAQ